MKKIKLILLLLATTFLFHRGLKAQAFQEDGVNVQLGYGVGNFMQSVFSTYDDDSLGYSFSAKGPLFFKLEYGASENIGFGINVAYAGANVMWTDNDDTLGDVDIDLDWNTISILLRLNVHFGDNDKFDPYFGVGLGYRTANWDASYSNPGYNEGNINLDIPVNFGFEMTAGARYFVTDKIGIYVEAGFAKAVLQGGLNIKLQ